MLQCNIVADIITEGGYFTSETKKGRPKIIVNGYGFRNVYRCKFEDAVDKSKHWRCMRHYLGCKVKAIMDPYTRSLILKTLPHNHPPDHPNLVDPTFSIFADE